MRDLIRWFSGGDNQYMTLWHCMNHDTFWVALVCVLCLAVVVGYLVIAAHWYSNLKGLKDGVAKSSLISMVNIFLFCGMVGYLFIPVKMFWPAWRLQSLFLAILAYFTWKYALNTPKLRVVYEELHKTGELAKELADEKTKVKELTHQIEQIKDPVERLSESVFFGLDDSSGGFTDNVKDIKKNALETETKLVQIIKKVKDKGGCDG